MGPEYPFGAISNFYENFVFIANLLPVSTTPATDYPATVATVLG
jgi:hypothetical protein